MSISTELAPLTVAERTLVERAGVRLGSELRVAINDLLPEFRSNARVLARNLTLDVSLCQGVLDAVYSSVDGMRTAAALSATGSTVRFVRALEYRLGRRIDALAVALNQYTELMRSLGATPTIATARIEQSIRSMARGNVADNGWSEGRRAAFEAVSSFTNSNADLLVDTRLLQPDAADPKMLMETTLTALVGLRTRGVGFPIASHMWHTGREPSELLLQSGVAKATRPAMLVKEFSTYPLPIVSSRDASASNMSLIDVRLDDTLESVDVAQERIALGLPYPNEADPMWSCAISARTPTKHLVATYLIPRDMAEASYVTSASYFWHPALSGDHSRHWHERLPGALMPEFLGIGLERMGHPRIEKIGRMAAYLFERCGVSPKDYAAYRIEVAYPVWGALYTLTFDFRA